MNSLKLVLALSIFGGVTAHAEDVDLNTFEITALSGLAITLYPTALTHMTLNPDSYDYKAFHLIETEAPGYLVELESNPNAIPSATLTEALATVRANHQVDATDLEIIGLVLSEL